MQTLNYGPYTISLFVGETSRDVVYAIMDESDAKEVWAALDEPKPTLAAVSGVDWNRELSPWPAPKAFRGSDDFSGAAPAFLRKLTGHIVPLVENRLDFTPSSRAIAGYSLAGLFALWAVFEADTFDRAASVSGSLWYDGFLEHMNTSILRDGVERVYLSLGDREKNTRNPRMAVVEERTRQMAELLEAKGSPVTFELTQGGHFNDAPGRITRAINALIKPAE